MKQNSLRRKSLVLATSSLAMTSFAILSGTAIAIASESIQPIAPENLALPKANADRYELTQTSDSCHQVAARNGLYVRRKPTVYSTALGIIASGRYVTVEPGGTNNWVPISAPLKGYVFADYLTSCQSAPPPKNCRQVAAKSGVYVRQEPSVDSAIVGVVTNGRYVTIENQNLNGWVQISVPLKGYVSANYLSDCS